MFSAPSSLRLLAAAIAFGTVAIHASQASAASLSVQLACATDYYAYCSKHDPDGPGVRGCMRANGPKLSQALRQRPDRRRRSLQGRSRAPHRREQVGSPLPRQSSNLSGAPARISLTPSRFETRGNPPLTPIVQYLQRGEGSPARATSEVVSWGMHASVRQVGFGHQCASSAGGPRHPVDDGGRPTRGPNLGSAEGRVAVHGPAVAGFVHARLQSIDFSWRAGWPRSPSSIRRLAASRGSAAGPPANVSPRSRARLGAKKTRIECQPGPARPAFGPSGSAGRPARSFRFRPRRRERRTRP